MRSEIVTPLFALILASCAHGREVVEISSVPAIQADLKHQIGIYLAAEAERRNKVEIGEGQDSNSFECGDGSLDFQIKSVKLDITTTLDKTNSGNASVAIPFSGGTVTPGLSRSDELASTQELTYFEYPWSPRAQDDSGVLQLAHDAAALEKAPIAKALINLRDNLIDASKWRYDANGNLVHGACFADVPTESLRKGADPDKNQAKDDNSFKIGITFTGVSENDLKIVLGPLTIGGSSSDKDIASNSITVAFVPTHWKVKQLQQHASLAFRQYAQNERGRGDTHTDAMAPAAPKPGTSTDRQVVVTDPDCPKDDPDVPQKCYIDGLPHSQGNPPEKSER